MTLVGKIFTVLVLLMSVVFMSLAVTVFATHRNWRDMVLAPEGLKAEIEKYHQINEQLRQEKARAEDALAIEQAARRFALAASEGRLEQLQGQLDTVRRENAELLAANTEATGFLATAQMNLEALTKEVEGLRTAIRAAQQERDAAFGQVVVLTDELNKMEGTTQSLRERRDQLIVQTSAMKKVLDRHGLDINTPVEHIPPTVDGVVTAVSDRDLVEISIGSDDGLREQHTLDVFRQATYVGRVRVLSTEPDRSVAAVLPEYRRGIIKKGDRVATRLN